MTICKVHRIMLRIPSDQHAGYTWVKQETDAWHKARGLWVASSWCLGRGDLVGTSKKDITTKLQADFDEAYEPQRLHLREKWLKELQDMKRSFFG